MTSISPRRTLPAVLLLACLALAAVPAHAGPPGLGCSRTEESFLLQVWGFVAGIFEKEGMSIDPDGKPEAGGETADPEGDNPDPGDAGMTIDPDG